MRRLLAGCFGHALCTAALLAAAVGTPRAWADEQPPYKNIDLPFEERAKDLVSRMTLQEKSLQIQMDAPQNARLGIPACEWWSEALHGVARAGTATVFPEAIGMAASWDPALLQRVADATSDEARAKFDPAGKRYYGLMLWSPTINMARDPRWGRTEETFGEDPYLTSRLGVAFVKGLQGGDPKYLKAVATPKHFAMHSQESNRKSASYNISERTLREYYFPAFEACVVEGNAMSTMAAFNGINSVPATANHWLLTDVLRNEWGFHGAVVTDYNAITDLRTGHGFVKTDFEAMAAALNAGIDIACEQRAPNQPSVSDSVLGAIKAGLLTEETLNRSLERSMTLRFKLGMFDPPDKVPFTKLGKSAIGSKEHIALALQMARESMVLLKNDPAPKGYGFEKLLPLDLRRINSIGVLGPFAKIQQTGAYSGSPVSPVVSPFAAITKAVGERVSVRTADYSDIERATSVAASSDVVIALMGLNSGMENEGVDRSSIELPIDQQLFLKKILDANPLTIVVLEGGSAIGMAKIKERCPAALMAWYPGEQGSNALAEVLLGQYNPSGKLPLTFYGLTADLPPITDYEISHGRTYMYDTKPVGYPFGYGLSYTTFSFGHLQLDAGDALAADSVLHMNFDITNTGARDGDEVVELYVARKDKSAVTRPARQLKGFQRITLAKGQTQPVSLTLPMKDLGYWDEASHKFVVEPGSYEVQIGESSSDIQLRASFRVKISMEW